MASLEKKSEFAGYFGGSSYFRTTLDISSRLSTNSCVANHGNSYISLEKGEISGTGIYVRFCSSGSKRI